MTLKNSKVFHEPFSSAYYFGPERQSRRYAPQLNSPEATYGKISKMLQKEYDGKDLVFSKDMAYCVENKFDIFREEGFETFQHTFLIRNPVKAVRSLYKASTNPKLTGWGHFDPTEAGFRQMLELYEFVKQHNRNEPVVVDADDLLESPNETMQSYCQAVGLEYEEHMTSWEPGPVPEWDTWTGWHDDALKSSGFKARTNKNKPTAFDIQDLPPEVAAVVEESMPYYQALAAKKILPNNVALQ